MPGPSEQEQLPPSRPSEEQALAIFNNAAEQRRFLMMQRWHIANYALLAFAALAAAPDWLEKGSWLDTGRSWVSFGAIVLVVAVLVLTLLYLSRARRWLGNQYQRMREAREHLSLMDKIHGSGQGTGPRHWSIVVVVVFGAFVAGLINLSRSSAASSL
jgi:hypothetical protein